MNNHKLRIAALAAGTALVVAGCAALTSSHDAGANAEQEAVALMKKDFHSRGQATLDRLDQDEVQKACTRYAETGKLPEGEAQHLQQAQHQQQVQHLQQGQHLPRRARCPQRRQQRRQRPRRRQLRRQP
jgi:hypothetical protein